MSYSLKLYRFLRFLPVLPFIIPILCIWVVNTSHFTDDPVSLSMAITFDLLITTPALYFLTIRKRSIPNTTVIPVFILGIVVASTILPMEHQYYLSLAKTWILPVVEISIITYIIITIRKAFKEFKSAGNLDFFSAAKQASAKILPKKVAILFATELSVFYYGFISWKKRSIKEHEFTYHKNTSTRMVLNVFIGLIIIEATAVHLLLQGWSILAAWILTGLSIYGCFQLLGILKSLSRRPISIEGDSLVLRYGIMNEVRVPYDNIVSFEPFTKAVEKNDEYAHLSPFRDMDGHNILLEVDAEMNMDGFYGMKKTFKRLLIFVDNPEVLLRQVENKISPSERSTL